MSLEQHVLPNGKTIFGINRNETSHMFREVYESGAYLPAGVAELPERPTIVDVGANIGIFAMFSAECWPGARVICFEPVPEVFEVLRENISGLGGVVAHNVAIGDREGVFDIVHYPRYTMLSGFNADAEVDRETVAAYIRNVTDFEGVEEDRELVLSSIYEMIEDRLESCLVPVRVKRLADLVAELEIDRIDLLKIDVEGAEIQVLAGFDDAVWGMLRNVVVEVANNENELDVVVSMFRNHGMNVSSRQMPEFRGTNLHMVFAEC